MTGQNITLPTFDAPPVVEMVLALEFPLLESWDVLDFGFFWKSIEEEYPRYDIKPPIGAPSDSAIVIDPSQLSQLPLRCWFYHKSNSKIIQVQADRFIYNWRRYITEDNYPRYESIRADLQAQWNSFCNFLESNNKKIPQITGCEITYINHIKRGDEWNNYSDLPKLIKLIPELVIKDEELWDPSSIAFQSVYSLPDNLGDLLILIQSAVYSPDQNDIIQMRLTATGEPESSNIEDVMKWLDKGREKVVMAFASITTELAHKKWQRKN